MSEHTITLHTFAGFTAARIMNVGFVASILFLFIGGGAVGYP